MKVSFDLRMEDLKIINSIIENTIEQIQSEIDDDSFWTKHRDAGAIHSRFVSLKRIYGYTSYVESMARDDRRGE